MAGDRMGVVRSGIHSGGFANWRQNGSPAAEARYRLWRLSDYLCAGLSWTCCLWATYYAVLLKRDQLTTVTGDTLTYTLGAMKPETAKASVVTADATAKQLALNKVSDKH
jgi:hypothetical protein